MKTRYLRRVYEAGYRAYFYGKLPKNNPYNEGIAEWKEWKRGWFQADSNTPIKPERK